MNIAVIAHIHYKITQPYAGGLEAHTDLLVRHLTKLGHTVTVYAKAGSKTDAKVVPIFAGNAKSGQNRLLKAAYRYAGNHIARHTYDLIFNNSLDSYPFKWHTPDMPPMITVFHTPPFWELSDVLQEQETQDNRTFIAVSSLTASQWQPFIKQKVTVVPNGVDMDLWQPHLKKPRDTSAVWVGHITPEKGTDIAIKAAIIADISLVLCGKIYDKKYFKNTIKPLLKNPNIHYKGHLNQHDVNTLYGQASVALVTPVWDEPFGFCTVEALASGTPVAGLDHGATAEILDGTYGSLASSDSPEDLAKAIRAGLKLDRRKGAEYAHATFSVTAMVERYLDLIPQTGQKDKDVALVWQTYP